MATKMRTFYTVKCDGKQHGETPLEFGDPTHSSAIEARAAAYAKGWRFPPKILVNGDQSPTQVSDVCPACQDTFEPERALGGR